MQLDQTQIAIRERGTLDLLDLATRVIVNYVRPLLIAGGLGVAPFAILNLLLLRELWGIPLSEEFLFELDGGPTLDYLRNMVLLVALEAPLAMALVTKYLGDAVFLKQPSLKSATWEVYRATGRLLWCHFVIRGLGLGLLFGYHAGTSPDFTASDFFLIVTVGAACLFRALRPFVNEIVLLERSPLRSRESATITVGRRSGALHSNAAGDLILKWIWYSIVGTLLVASVFFGLVFVTGVLANDWSIGPLMIQTFFPLSLWIVAGFLAVVRFLAYLDLRIRHEGWEVELRMRAEGARIEART